MHVTAEKVERRRTQSKHTGKYESRSNRLSRRKPDNQKQRRNGKTPTADSCQAHNQGDEKTQKEVHYSARSEKVWIPSEQNNAPPSGFFHRPDCGPDRNRRWEFYRSCAASDCRASGGRGGWNGFRICRCASTGCGAFLPSRPSRAFALLSSVTRGGRARSSCRNYCAAPPCETGE